MTEMTIDPIFVIASTLYTTLPEQGAVVNRIDAVTAAENMISEIMNTKKQSMEQELDHLSNTEIYELVRDRCITAITDVVDFRDLDHATLAKIVDDSMNLIATF